MREIKFRAWFEIEKKMVASENLIFEYDGREDEPYTFAFDDTDTYYDDNNEKQMKGTMGFVPMQYTGFKDQSNTEIYIGDIVALSGPHAKFEVTINPLTQVPVIDSEQGQENLYEMYDSLVVIGNIYENPELLGDNYV